MGEPLKVFITYSHEDTDSKDKLRQCLAVMEQQGLITIWHDNEILPGDKWYKKISKNLNDSDILLYIVSASSLASKNCNKELADALSGEIRIIPIILEDCDWQNHQLSDVQALPDQGKPINEWQPESKGWQNVVVGLQKVVEIMRPNVSDDVKETLPEWVFQQGNFLMMLGQSDKAIEAYSHAIELNPNNTIAYYNRGIAYGDKGAHDHAISNYSKAIDLQPDYTDAYYNRGNTYSDKGVYNRAITDYNKAIELNPDNAMAYCNRGIAYNCKGAYNRAIADYNKAIELNPELAESYNNRGIAYGSKGAYDRAIADFSKLIDLNPEFALAYHNRGNTYHNKGAYDRAIADFSKSIDLNPEFALAYHNRGMCWLHLQNWQEARSDLTVAKSIGEDIIAAFRNDYKNVEAFERRHGLQLPADIAAMLTQRRRSRFPKIQKDLIQQSSPLNLSSQKKEILSANVTLPKSPDVVNLLEELRDTGIPLEQYVAMPSHFGIKTGMDDAFVVDGELRDKLIADHSSSADILKPFLHGRDIKRWQVDAQDLWLIFAYHGIEIDAYPAILKHIKKYRDSLSKRTGKQKWYELQAVPGDSEYFTQPKLVCPNRYNHQTFAVDTDGLYCGNTCYLISTEETWLCGILNSSVVEWFYSQVSDQLTADELRALSGYIQQVPIPNVTSTQKALIGKIVNYLIYLQKQPTTNSKDLAHARDYMMLKYFERIIDGLVYECYLPETLHQGDKYFFKPLLDEHLPQPDEISGNKMSVFRGIFEHLYERTHSVRKNLFFLDSVKPVRIIEGKW